MKIASLSNIKKELKERSHLELVACCLKMAKYARNNKELLNYLLFEAYDEENYRQEIKNEIELEFAEVNTNAVYFAKKSIRKILRIATKFIKYSGSKQTQVEILIFFCQNMRNLNLPFSESKVLINLYERQLINIKKAMDYLNEDLQFDYQGEIEEIDQPLARIYY